MANNSIKTVNFGTSKGSLTTVGYRLYAFDGTLSGSRITANVGEVLDGAGIYSSSVHFADHFKGSILWDTGESAPTYASEDYSPVLDLVSSSIDFTKHMTSGRWKLDSSANQMIFYKEDNSTELARFSLTDDDGNGSVTSVFQRTKV